jgi:signal recognition particle receptor subunit beta
MESSILFLGPVGAGKTQAIRTISDIEVVSTEADATDETARLKRQTTVAMDMGVMHLDGQDKVILYGAPGQDRFDFMWEILLTQVRGLVLLIDHSGKDPVADLAHYIKQLRVLDDGRTRPLVIGVTHADLAVWRSLAIYREYLRDNAADQGGETIPVFRADARNRREVNNLLLALTSMMDFLERFPKRAMA